MRALNDVRNKETIHKCNAVCIYNGEPRFMENWDRTYMDRISDREYDAATEIVTSG